MLTMKPLLTAVAVLSFAWPCCAVGRVPEGAYTSEAFGFDAIEEAIKVCEDNVHCAGLTHRPPDENDPEPTIHFHNFLPHPLLDESKAAGWTTQRSAKHFVFHPGKVVSKDILTLDVDLNNTSLTQIQEKCASHPECAVFSYKVHSNNIDGFSELVFASSVDDFTETVGDDWRSFVVNNDETKISKLNAKAFVYDDDLESHPYSTCCNRRLRHKGTRDVPSMPTIEEIERIDSLPRVPCSISKEDFQAKYENSRTPVMLVGCDEDWPAKTRWNMPDLLDRFDNDTTWRVETHYSNGDLLDNVKWSEIKEDVANGNWFYIFDNLDHEHGKTVEEDYSWPPQFAGSDLYEKDFPPDWGSRRWWCVGSKSSGTLPHMDPFGTDAWNSLLQGHKWWIIYPSVVRRESMVKCDASCSPRDPESIDWYASVGIDAERTQYGDGSRPIHALQKPGETIYVPNGLVHSVYNMDDTIAITANYGSPSNLQQVWETVLRKGSDKQWQKMFFQRFTEEQRKAVREGPIWPPEEFAGVDIYGDNGTEEDDDIDSGDSEDYDSEDEEEEYEDSEDGEDEGSEDEDFEDHEDDFDPRDSDEL